MFVLIYLIVIGLAVGYFGGMLIKSRFGTIGNLIVGVLGSLSGGFIFNSLGIYPGRGWPGVIIVGILGAILFLLILWIIEWSLIRSRKSNI